MIKISVKTTNQNVGMVTANAANSFNEFWGVEWADFVPDLPGYNTYFVSARPNGQSGVILYDNGWIYNANNWGIGANTITGTYVFLFVHKSLII